METFNEKIHYKFDQDTKILYKYYYGDISIQDIATSWEHAIENNMIPKEVKGFILDYREATFDFSHEKHREIVDFYRNNLEIFGNLKTAIIVTEPKNMVIPVLVKAKDKGYTSQPFSTIEAALKWVLN